MDHPAAAPLDARRLIARIVVHIVPRARVSAVAGRYGDAIKIRIAAPPVNGAANAELVRFLAERLDVPRGAIAITAGQSARRKTVEIRGAETGAVLTRLVDS